MKEDKKRHPLQIDEQTRVNLTFNNFWAILASAVMIAFALGSVYIQHQHSDQKLDEMIVAQNNFNAEFMDWKKSVEERLGKYALKINTLETVVGIKN